MAIRGKSGLKMWTSRVRKLYATLEECEAYCSAYGIADRLGYPDARALWDANPVIGGSVIPSDLKVIRA